MRWGSARVESYLFILTGLIWGSAQADPDWSEIEAQAPAVVESWDTYWKIETGSWSSRLKLSKRVLVKNERGFFAANQTVSYFSGQAKIAKWDAKTIQPDGEEIPIPESLIHERRLPEEDGVSFTRRQFTYPRVRAGSVLSLDLELEINVVNKRLPVYGSVWPIQGALPVRAASLKIQIGSGAAAWRPFVHPLVPIEPYCTIRDGFGAAETDERLDAVKEVLCQNVPAVIREPMSPPAADRDLSVAVLSTVGASKADFSSGAPSSYYKWLDANFKNALGEESIPESIRTIARQWSGSELRPDKKVEAIAAWVRHNVALSYDRRQELLDRIVTERAGAPDERNLVALALMKSAGLQARGSILIDKTMRRYNSENPAPTSAWNFVVMLGDLERPTYIDVNCEACVPGVPPWYLSGSGSGGFLFLPLERVRVLPIPAQANAQRRSREVVLEPNGAARVSGSVEWQMQQDVDRREVWGRLPQQQQTIDCLGATRSEPANVQLEITDAKDLSRNLGCRFSYTDSRWGAKLGSRLIVHPPDDFTELLQLPIQERRRTAIRWRYARSQQSDLLVKLPAGMHVSATPQPIALSAPGMSFRAQWTLESGGTAARLRAVLLIETDELPAAAYPSARVFAGDLAAFLRGGIVVESRP